MSHRSEIGLPDTQPGSSRMPGKLNPVICESVIQVTAHVIGRTLGLKVSFNGCMLPHRVKDDDRQSRKRA
jgi:aspartate ammonia-lyase